MARRDRGMVVSLLGILMGLLALGSTACGPVGPSDATHSTLLAVERTAEAQLNATLTHYHGVAAQTLVVEQERAASSRSGLAGNMFAVWLVLALTVVLGTIVLFFRVTNNIRALYRGDDPPTSANGVG